MRSQALKNVKNRYVDDVKKRLYKGLQPLTHEKKREYSKIRNANKQNSKK